MPRIYTRQNNCAATPLMAAGVARCRQIGKGRQGSVQAAAGGGAWAAGRGQTGQRLIAVAASTRYWLVPRLPTFEETHRPVGDGEWRRHLREHVLAICRLGTPQQEKARVPPVQGAAGDGAGGDREGVGQGGAPQHAPHPESRGEDTHVLDARRHHVQRAAHVLLTALTPNVAQPVAGAGAARLLGHHAIRPAMRPLL